MKTVLSNQIRSTLEKRNSTVKVPVLSLYLAYDRRSVQSLEHCLKSLLYQMLRYYKDGNDKISPALRDFKEGVNQTGAGTEAASLESLLLEELAHFNDVYIIVDGLEELDEESAQSLEDTMLRAQNVAGASGINVQLVLFTRTLRETVASVEIECDAQRPGCEKYVCLSLGFAFAAERGCVSQYVKTNNEIEQTLYCFGCAARPAPNISTLPVGRVMMQELFVPTQRPRRVMRWC